MLIKNLDRRRRNRLGKTERARNAAAVNHKIDGAVYEQMLIASLGLAIKSILGEEH